MPSISALSNSFQLAQATTGAQLRFGNLENGSVVRTGSYSPGKGAPSVNYALPAPLAEPTVPNTPLLRTEVNAPLIRGRGFSIGPAFTADPSNRNPRGAVVGVGAAFRAGDPKGANLSIDAYRDIDTGKPILRGRGNLPLGERLRLDLTGRLDGNAKTGRLQPLLSTPLGPNSRLGGGATLNFLRDGSMQPSPVFKLNVGALQLEGGLGDASQGNYINFGFKR
jgi:hypothetical protein